MKKLLLAIGLALGFIAVAQNYRPSFADNIYGVPVEQSRPQTIDFSTITASGAITSNSSITGSGFWGDGSKITGIVAGGLGGLTANQFLFGAGGG